MKDVVVIPTYNEKQNIQALVEAIFRVSPQVKILVVDDNSPDGTGSVVDSLKDRFPNLSLLTRMKKEGLGRAYLGAFAEVLKDETVESVIMMDADFSHDPSYISLMIEMKKSCDVVVASRYVKGGGTVGWELWRRLLSRWGNFYAHTITRLPTHDCTGGFNLIKTEFLRKVNLSEFDASGYAFQIELKYRLWKSGARFCELPIVFKNRISGESKISQHIIAEGVIAPWKMIFKK